MKFNPEKQSAKRRQRNARKRATAYLPYAASTRRQLAKAIRWLRGNCPPGESIYVPDDQWNYLRKMVVKDMGRKWHKFKVSRPEKNTIELDDLPVDS